MNKQKALKVVNAILALDFAVLILTVLFRSALPYELYQVAHPIPGYLLLVLVAAHLYLNWGWVKQNYLKAKPKA